MYNRSDISTKLRSVMNRTLIAGTLCAALEIAEDVIQKSYQGQNAIDYMETVNRYIEFAEMGVGLTLFATIIEPLTDAYFQYKSKSSSSKR